MALLNDLEWRGTCNYPCVMDISRPDIKKKKLRRQIVVLAIVALGVTAADAAILFTLTNNQLTLDNLSLIYRVNALALASKFSISNLIAVAGLLSPTAANATTPKPAAPQSSRQKPEPRPE